MTSSCQSTPCQARQKTPPLASKGEDDNCGDDDGDGDDDKDGSGSWDDDNGGFADDDEGGGSDKGWRDDESNGSAAGESGGNDDERGQKSPGVSTLERRLSSWLTRSDSLLLSSSSLLSLKLECDKLASEKSEMQRHYIMVSESVCICVVAPEMMACLSLNVILQQYVWPI